MIRGDATRRVALQPGWLAACCSSLLCESRTGVPATVRSRVPGALLLAAAAWLGAAPLGAQSLAGFAPPRAQAQQQCEARLQQLPTPASFREHLRRVTEAPHPTGSQAQREVGEYIAGVMERAGLRVERAAYDVYLPQLDGMVNEVEIVTPQRVRLQNREPAIAADPFTAHPALTAAWNAYSGSGDVTAEVVYANYGRKEDFEQLARLGVDVGGRIVLARYGGNFRGYKVKFAEERGAVGVIMFNDPGFAEGGEYPDGRNMTPFTVQRGSVLTLPWTGDPLTPFEPALPLEDGNGAAVKRLDPADVAFHRIPVLPVGYGAARQILELMKGPEAPAAWAGGLRLQHRLTGGPELRVRVNVQQRLDYTRAVNVIGWVEGAELPDEWVLLGSHYDPWGFGAHDPNGGTAMLLTLAESLGRLASEGCRPRRSIAIAHWDAEEYGIIGSTEWVEHRRDELAARAVAYINADGAVTGSSFSASASPSLKQPIIDAARAVRYPGGDGSVYDSWTTGAQGPVAPRLGDLGGGSDHVGFYTHVGVPSAGLSLGSSNGIYHSNYDTFAFFERFSDADFIYGPTLARVDGVLALRLANADAIPYDIARYGTDIGTHAKALEELAATLDVTARLDGLRAAAASFAGTARLFEAARDAWLARDADAPTARALNTRLIALEKAFIHMDGLQERPWSRSLYASPDPFSGYASWMLPGIRYEIETRNAAGVVAWEAKYIAAVRELERRVADATALLTARR